MSLEYSQRLAAFRARRAQAIEALPLTPDRAPTKSGEVNQSDAAFSAGHIEPTGQSL